MAKQKKKHKGPKPQVHRPDGGWTSTARGKRSKVLIKSDVLSVHVEKRRADDKNQYSEYTVKVDNEVYLMDVVLTKGNTGVSLVSTATEAMIEKVGNSQIRKPVQQDFPYPSRYVLELYDSENNLLLFREAERVCRAIRAGEIEQTLVVKERNEIETHFTYNDKKYVTYTDLYFNPMREFACIYLDNETFVELAILQLNPKALTEIQDRLKKTMEKPTSIERGIIESLLAFKTQQYITIKDLDWNELTAGEAEYVAGKLRAGETRVIDENDLGDAFGSIQKLSLCGDKLCFIGAEPTFDPTAVFSYDCADAKDGELYTALMR